ncbi:hypothetical protein, partial [Rhodococcus yananensis]|uniref:hypothetical protein n=1 Tax=Rhodococcus yananensis TaxID=2879464 RepID=UPI001CF8AE41
WLGLVQMVPSQGTVLFPPRGSCMTAPPLPGAVVWEDDCDWLPSTSEGSLCTGLVSGCTVVVVVLVVLLPSVSHAAAKNATAVILAAARTFRIIVGLSDW